MKNTNDSVKVQGMFRVNITENGKVVGDSGWRKNQITNLGFNQYLVGSLGNISGKSVTHAALGTGGAPAAADEVALGQMAADIYVNESQATTDQIVAAVWNAIASEYDLSGTMGEKLNAAGTAGDPWTTDLSSYTTAGTAGKILSDTKKALTLAKFLGLK